MSDGDRLGCRLRCQCAWGSRSDDDVNPQLHELRDQLGKPLVFPVGPPPLDGDVVTLHVSQLAQAIAEGQDGR